MPTKMKGRKRATPRRGTKPKRKRTSSNNTRTRKAYRAGENSLTLQIGAAARRPAKKKVYRGHLIGKKRAEIESRKKGNRSTGKTGIPARGRPKRAMKL